MNLVVYFYGIKMKDFQKTLLFGHSGFQPYSPKGVICAIFVFQNRHRNTQIHWSSRCQTCAIQNGHKNQNGHKPLNFSINNTI